MASCVAGWPTGLSREFAQRHGEPGEVIRGVGEGLLGGGETVAGRRGGDRAAGGGDQLAIALDALVELLAELADGGVERGLLTRRGGVAAAFDGLDTAGQRTQGPGSFVGGLPGVGDREFGDSCGAER